MKALVTGGGGFLGTAIVRRLLDRGKSVRSFSRNRYPHLGQWGADQRQGDLADANAVWRAAEGCDIVFHVGAKAGYWGRYRDYYKANVRGTSHVIEACHKNNIRRLVFTSSPSVIASDANLENVDETYPYPHRYFAHYPKTKAMAEQVVLAANGPDLATVALRPHLVWGIGDHHLIPRLVARARAGHLRLIGDGKNRVDATYIGNVVDAHLLAADRLKPGSRIAGRAYFISNDEPVEVGWFIRRLLEIAGLPRLRRSISPQLAHFVGATLEFTHRLLRLKGEPRMTRFLAHQLSRSHWFDITAAKCDLGYVPRVSVDEGLRRIEPWLRQL